MEFLFDIKLNWKQDGQLQGNTTRTVIIQEGKNLRLRCGTAGNPRPEISWRRADGSLTPMGSWQSKLAFFTSWEFLVYNQIKLYVASDVLGPTFNITRVHREHMGVYVCGMIKNN